MADQLTGLLSPFLRSRRIVAARSFIGQRTVLDIGCGTGELARYIDSTRYLGVDRDQESIAIARKKFPAHQFLTLAEFSTSPHDSRFEQIIGLAIIEHVDAPQQWLVWLRTLLKPRGRLILTTPHPSMRRPHEFGAAIGLFSHEGAKEHRQLIDGKRMIELAESSGFRILHFQKFLLGCNQLFILEGTE